jgi:hypothetical protein
MHEVLTKNGNFSIKKEHFLLNAEATSDNIRTAISDLFWQSEEKLGTALFYFAGHGGHDHLGYLYLLPHDVDINAPYVKGICVQDLKRLFIDSRVNTSAIMILDCCYSGIATGARSGGVQEVDVSKSVSDVCRLESTGSGRFILASAPAGAKAREKKQKHTRGSEEEHIHGLYSFHLIEALRGAAADEHGYVSLGYVFKHIDKVFRDNDPGGIPPISAVGIDMDGIWLTEITEQVSGHLEERYGLIEDCISNKTPRNLLSAVDEIIDLESRGSGDKDRIIEYLKQIDQFVNEFKSRCRDWWITHNSILNRDREIEKRWFVVLQSVLPDFTLDNYRKRDQRTRGFLTEVVEAIVNDQDYRSITKYIRDEKRAPRIGSENINVAARGEAARL